MTKSNIKYPIGETNYVIEKAKNGWKLVYTNPTAKEKTNPRTKKKEMVNSSYDRYYGCLYQCLQGFVKDYGDKGNSLEDVSIRYDYAMNLVGALMRKMEEADKELAEKYKIVKVSNG